MMKWYSNEYDDLGMSSKWWNEVGMTCFQIQSKILTTKMEASYWSRAQNWGLSLVERTPGKKSKALTLIWKFHSFQCHSTHSDVFPFILTSFHHSDVTQEFLHWDDRTRWKWERFSNQGQSLRFFSCGPLDQWEASILSSRPIGSLDFGSQNFGLN